MTTRKRLQENHATVKGLFNKLEYIKEVIETRVGDKKSDQVFKTLNETMAKLEKEIKALPTEHVYSDTFYYRKPYTEPMESVQVAGGTASMREDLVSWLARDKDGNHLGLFRNVYKDPKLKEPINREDGDAVFAD